MWTSSLECSNNKNSGVVAALARPTELEILAMTFLQNVVGMCYMYYKKWPKASRQGTAKE
jgi:hypothetical protein